MEGPGGMIGTAVANHLWAGSLISALHARGLRRVVLSPGSRSTPLVWAAYEHPGITITVQIDERSAAFFALGLAKGSRRPVAAICTSGSAAANYFPAAIEASLASVPLLLMTADRPPEARGTGASQTCDQLHLYGDHVRLFRDLPCPDGDIGSSQIEEMVRSAGRIAQEAILAACGVPPGPVHLNVPFREPLVPSRRDLERIEEIRSRSGATDLPTREIGKSHVHAPGAVPEGTLGSLIDRISRARRPLIIAGPETISTLEAGSVFGFARSARIPIFADVASGLRFAGGSDGALLLSHADLFLRDERVESHPPDLVLRLGGVPTSKSVAAWLARHRPPVLAIQPDARRRDPDGIVGGTIVGPAGALCERLRQRCRGTERDDAWYGLLCEAEKRAEGWCTRAPLEGAAVREACAAVPLGASIFLSNSMPIRWAEMYASVNESGAHVFVNRGVNGIDGIISTALGVALGSDTPMLLVTGDLALLHDLGGLRAAAAMRRPVAILLLNNDGGGIFSHLPIADHPGILDPFFGSPHGVDLGSAVRAFGISHVRVPTARDAAAAVREILVSEGVRVVEVRTDREVMADEHRRLVESFTIRSLTESADGILWHIRETGAEQAPAVTLLHGFGGTGAFWSPIAQRLHGLRRITPDLPGHGETQAPIPPEEWRMERAAGALISLLDRLEVGRCALAGYSMGGRLALHTAVRFPERISHLILFGVSAGIASAEERRVRAAADLDLAESITRDGIAAFAEQWEALPMFESQQGLPPKVLESMRAQRRMQDPERLTAALRAFGSGFQTPLQDRLETLRIPTLIVAGQNDVKYSMIAREMAAAIPQAKCRIIAGAGHAVPLERPEESAALIDSFLKGALEG